MTSGRRALLRFGLLLLAALALQAIPGLFLLLEGEVGILLYLIWLYAVLPLSALFLAFFAGKGGVHPMAAFFPVGGIMLLLPVYQSPGMALLCLLLSLIGATAGQEWEKRKAPKGKKHG